MSSYYVVRFGAVYGEGAYGNEAYSCMSASDPGCTTTVNPGAATSGTTTASGAGGLADTGVWVLGLVTLACFVVFAALIVRMWRRKPAVATESIFTEHEYRQNSSERRE